MNRDRVASKRDIFEHLAYRVDHLPHPVDLISIEEAAARAHVPKSTATTAIPSQTAFRSMLLAESIGRLDVSPGPLCWEAVRAARLDHSPEVSVARLVAGRATELAADAAFPLYLSAFDFLDGSLVGPAVAAVTDALAEQFHPFLHTVIEASNMEMPDRHPAREFLITHIVLTEAYRRLLGVGTARRASQATLERHAASTIVLELDRSDASLSGELTAGSWTDGSPHRARIEGTLRSVVEAGATIVLEHGVPLRTGVTLAQVLSASGMSSATFYRRFASMTAFEEELLKQTGRGLADGFRDQFFDDLVEGVRTAEATPAEAIAMLRASAMRVAGSHVEGGRPGHQVMPWLGVDVGRRVFASAYLEAFEERGVYYSQFADIAGLRLCPGLTSADVAGALNAHSVVSELLIRIARRRAWAAGVIGSRMPVLYNQLFHVDA